MFDERVLRLGEDADEIVLGKLLHRRDDGEAAREFRDEPELNEVLRANVTAARSPFPVPRLLLCRAKSYSALAGALADYLVESDKSTAADEEDVRGVDLDVLLVRMLAATFRRDTANRTFKNLEKRLLNALARDVARDRHIVGLRRDLVYFVDVDYAALRKLDVAVGVLEKVSNEVFDVFANISRLREHRRVADGERNAEHLRKRPREKRLARSRRPDKEDVRLLDLNIGKFFRGLGCGGAVSPSRRLSAKRMP